MKDLNSLFIHAFAGYSSSIEIVHQISSLILSAFKAQYACSTLSEVLKLDQNYLLDNMMVKIVSGKNKGGGELLRLVQTLKSQCKEIMGSIVTDMVQMVI